ncbi:IS200/IS605 family accessory protein TnpB-related protein [Hydrogenobacter thermophilus]|uniref:IS200/IS605 family accessory protein TnpB-related protein n=1 Tax=Hydrogenobacter thermophilus TaxID=940 RepID=UPI0030FB5411
MKTAKTTIQARLKVKGEERKILDDLMRRWSSCMRFAYKRLLEGKTRNELKSLKIKDKGHKGDYSGRKLRRIRHSFSYKKLKERIISLARRYGIAIKEVNPAYTSLIGILKYAPQRGLGLSKRVPKNYLKLIESSQRESGTVSESTDGRNSGTAQNLRRSPYNLWRVLRVVAVPPLFPERLPRCLSPLKPLMVSGDVGRTPLRERETLRPGVGSMAGEIAPAGFIPSLKWRNTNSSAPELCANVQLR